MNANKKLLLKEDVYRIVGCAMEVINGLGHGLHEKSYENALVMEFGSQGIPFVQQPRSDVVYKNINVGKTGVFSSQEPLASICVNSRLKCVD